MTLSTQFLTMLAMIAMGSFFGASLDTYKRFFKRSAIKRWIIFVNDILFWIFQGLLTFYVLYAVNMGELRFYIFIALFCGFAAYKGLFQDIYLKVLETMISVFISIYQFIVKLIQLLIVRPIQLLIMTAITLVLFFGRGLFSLIKMALSIVNWLLMCIWKPIQLLMLFLWKLLPKNIKNSVEKLYNKLAGIFRKIKNYVYKVYKRINKKKK